MSHTKFFLKAFKCYCIYLVCSYMSLNMYKCKVTRIIRSIHVYTGVLHIFRFNKSDVNYILLQDL